MLRVVFVLCASLLICGCNESDENIDKAVPITETRAFAYVHTASHDERDIDVLNRWIRANPNKKVTSFSGVLAYREGVSGYIIHFTPGDNAHMHFARIDRKQSESAIHGIDLLEKWKDANPNARIVAISTVPSYSGGVREYTICYER